LKQLTGNAVSDVRSGLWQLVTYQKHLVDIKGSRNVIMSLIAVPVRFKHFWTSII